MFDKIRALTAELKRQGSLRVAFALAPFHGSDREVGWNALESDRDAGRNVSFITSSVDFLKIASHFPDNISDRFPSVLVFDTVRVVEWPFDLSSKLLPVGYLRFLIWVVLLQLFISASSYRKEKKKVHFLTYTQLSTPIILSKSFDTYHGPAGTIPLIPWRSPAPKLLVLKSQLMWRGIMPIAAYLRRRRSVRGTVVHPNLAKRLAHTGEMTVLSALNVDYLASTHCASSTSEKCYDAVAVGRDISIKNMSLIADAFEKAGPGLEFLIINSSLPSAYVEKRGNTTILGRQDRHIVANYLCKSRLHVMLSLEFGGYINLEAASCGIPTLCLAGFGASFMLNPSEPFKISLDNLRPDCVADTISSLIADHTKLRHEGTKQMQHSRDFIENNRIKFEHWLEETTSDS